MAKAGESVLARKIAASKEAPAATRTLHAFAENTVREFTRMLGALLDASLAGETTARNALFVETAGDDRPALHFTATGGDGALGAHVILDGAFAETIAVRLLGGEMATAAKGVSNMALASGMATPVIGLLLQAINDAAGRLCNAKTADALTDARRVASAEEAMRHLETAPVFVFTIDLRFGETKAEKAFSVSLPLAALRRLGLETGERPLAEADPHAADRWRRKLRENILCTEMPLDVCLDRIETTVGFLSSLEVGQVLDIDSEALSSLSVSVQTASGRADIARGRLGALKNRKAVKLTTPIDEAFLNGLRA